MEEKHVKLCSSSSHPWWQQQDSWLQTTLSELDNKMKKIIEVVEDGEHTSAGKAEVYYQRRLQLIEMVQNLHSCHHDLANKYHLVMVGSESRATFTTFSCNDTSSSSSSSSNRDSWILEEAFKEHEDTPGQTKMEEEKQQKAIKYTLEKNQTSWKELGIEMCSLIEDNISIQAELIERNNENREFIRQLLKENRRLKQKLAAKQSIIDIPDLPPRSSFSRFKRSVREVFLK